MLIKTFASSLQGVDATTISVEVSVGPGMKYYLVGLPDNAVKEAWHRMETAIRYNDFLMPRIKIVINLAPADLRKEGSAYDLPMAIGILAASGQIDTCGLGDFVLMGELSLDGSLQPIRGALPIAVKAKREGFRGVILPEVNAREAALVDDLEVYGANDLRTVAEFVGGRRALVPVRTDVRKIFETGHQRFSVDFREVRGQRHIKRALEIAAAGGHNALLIGPPGAGKTMLARRIPTILPPLSLEEALETTKIHSVAGRLPENIPLISQRPFRAPHHTISDVALVGGGTHPSPGEISLAHNGVLFLDELPEFKRTVLEVMRQPMEERRVTISRARQSVDYPANFMLIASMNPCPCGYFNHPTRACVCGPTTVHRYLSKISGPLLDRIDLHVEVTPVEITSLSGKSDGEPSEVIRERVVAARMCQSVRLAHTGVFSNAQMGARQSREYCRLDASGKKLLDGAMEKLQLSARAYDRILKVARTIADLEDSDMIMPAHLAEAIRYRSLDREGWAG